LEGHVREAELQDRILLRLSREPGVLLWRNNTGVARHWSGGREHLVRYGLGVGGADLVGLVDGRFFALEVKTIRGAIRGSQRAWLDLVRRYGGFAAVVRSVEEAVDAVAACRRGERGD
jgi:hypothetical protein